MHLNTLIFGWVQLILFHSSQQKTLIFCVFEYSSFVFFYFFSFFNCKGLFHCFFHCWSYKEHSTIVASSACFFFSYRPFYSFFNILYWYISLPDVLVSIVLITVNNIFYTLSIFLHLLRLFHSFLDKSLIISVLVIVLVTIFLLLLGVMRLQFLAYCS